MFTTGTRAPGSSAARPTLHFLLATGKRIIIVHAITKAGPLVTVDKESGYPIEEGWFMDRRDQGSVGRGRGRGEGGERNQGSEADVGGTASGESVDDSRSTIAEELTAEFIFPAGEKSALSDCHKNIDADTFMVWIEKRLVPVLKAKYPGRSMILILDNEPYHHGRADDWKSPLQARRRTSSFVEKWTG